MSWTVQQAKDLGLQVILDRYAYSDSVEWYFRDQTVLIDLKHRCLAAAIIEDEIAAASPKFDTLEECLVYLRLRA